MSFGKYPDVSFADARLHHAQARRQLANGVDPIALRREVKEKSEAVVAEVDKPGGLTFEDLTCKFFDW
jgi:hypothetical protein